MCDKLEHYRASFSTKKVNSQLIFCKDLSQLPPLVTRIASPHLLPLLCAMEARTLTASPNARVPRTQDDVEIASSTLSSTSKPRLERSWLPGKVCILPLTALIFNPCPAPKHGTWSRHCLEKNWDKTLGDVLQVAVPSHHLRLRASSLRSFDVKSEKVVAGIGVENSGNRRMKVWDFLLAEWFCSGKSAFSRQGATT